MPKTSLRAVPDTNILLASEMSSASASPNREFFERWKADEFALLFSGDTLLEYSKKLRDKNLADDRIKTFLGALMVLGIERKILLQPLAAIALAPSSLAIAAVDHAIDSLRGRAMGWPRRAHHR